MHRRDAEMIKQAGCNWVRCSHYPHDPDFLDALDDLGLFALEESPTWMGQGNTAWLDNLEKSFRSMIRRDRNHPGIIIWSSCVNHEGCNDRLSAGRDSGKDPGRTRGACDVPTPMDFGAGSVSGNGALTIEYTGHTYPSARGDVGTQLEHAKRHWEMTNAAYDTLTNSGLAVWCGFDYNTTRSTDEPGIAHHGVWDIYRLPKLTYYWHMSELTSAPMVYVYKTSDPTTATVFSNCEQVRLSQNAGSGDTLVGTKSPDKGSGKDYLKHAPFTFTVSSGVDKLKRGRTCRRIGERYEHVEKAGKCHSAQAFRG
jgi:beta-galactosidase